jgi:hypothetical protein
VEAAHKVLDERVRGAAEEPGGKLLCTLSWHLKQHMQQDVCRMRVSTAAELLVGHEARCDMQFLFRPASQELSPNAASSSCSQLQRQTGVCHGCVARILQQK